MVQTFFKYSLRLYVSDIIYVHFNVGDSYNSPNFPIKRPVDEIDGYEQQVTKKMRIEPGDGPTTTLRILVNSKDAGGIIGKVCNGQIPSQTKF